MDQIRSVGSKEVKLDQNWTAKIWGWGLVPLPCPILYLVIFDYWKTWLKLVMLENFQACFFFFFLIQKISGKNYFVFSHWSIVVFNYRLDAPASKHCSKNSIALEKLRKINWSRLTPTARWKTSEISDVYCST